MADPGLEHHHRIFQEMMAHPPLFTHPRPEKIVIIGGKDTGTLNEVLKHPQVDEAWQITEHHATSTDPRARLHQDPGSAWVKKASPDSFDIVISLTDMTRETFTDYFELLRKQGILIQQSTSPFELDTLKNTAQLLQASGFCDVQVLSFPQPQCETSWRSAIMAVKKGTFNRIREKDIFNKTFKTHYYNFDVHKAALVLPEFIRHEWVG